MLMLHWPNWFDIQEVMGDAESWIDRFRDFVSTSDCPTFVKAQVSKAQRYADHPQEPVFEEDEGDDAVEAEEQPDWVDVYAGQNQRYEGVEKTLILMMVEMTMTGAIPTLFFLKAKTPRSGFKRASKKMKNRKQKLLTLNYHRCLHCP